jgi:hypothetical protein
MDSILPSNQMKMEKLNLFLYALPVIPDLIQAGLLILILKTGEKKWQKQL